MTEVRNADLENRDALEIAKRNYRDYSQYVIETRAYPSLIDGCKSSQRRVIHCSAKNLPRKRVKSATAVGEITKLHPHPTSIYGVIVSMASKYDCPFPLFDTKGNFGGNGHPAAAERYTEVMLSDLAIKIFESFSDYVDITQGEMDTDEPKNLATLLPLCFLHGCYGIPSGMSTVDMPPLNPIDIIKYCIEILKSKDINTVPNILVKPNVGDVFIKSTKEELKELLRTGVGSVTYQPKIELMDDNRSIEITGLPPGKTFDHVRKILDPELLRDQIDLRDETTTAPRYVVEIPPYRRVSSKELIERLRSKLTTRCSYKYIFTDNGKAIFCGFNYAIKENLKYLMKCCERKFKTELTIMENRLKVLQTIEEMKKNKDIIKLVEMSKDQAIEFICKNYETTDEQANSLLSKPLTYLTKEHNKEITDLIHSIESNKNNTKDIYSYLLEIYKSLLSEVNKFTKGLNMKFTEFLK